MDMQVSYTFSRDFISLLLKDVPARDFGRTPVLVKALRRVCHYLITYCRRLTVIDRFRLLTIIIYTVINTLSMIML